MEPNRTENNCNLENLPFMHRKPNIDEISKQYKINEFLKIKEECIETYNKYEHDGRIGDIAGNLTSILELMTYTIETNYDRYLEKYEKDFIKIKDYLNDYFELLEKNEEFKKAETTKSKGYFPEFDELNSNEDLNERAKKEGFRTYKEHYIAYCKENLKKESKEEKKGKLENKLNNN